MDALSRDIRFGIRTLRRSPMFTVVSVVVLGIGVGISGSVFSIVNATVLNPVPWRNAERVVELQALHLSTEAEAHGVSPAQYRDWRLQARSFTDLLAVQPARFNLTGADDGTVVAGALVEASALAVFGIEPGLGRGFVPGDGALDAEPVVLLSHGYFQRRYGGDPSVVGRGLEIDGAPATIIGVLSADQFIPRRETEMIAPLRLRSAGLSRIDRSLRVLGVLAPGVGIEAAQQEMDLVMARLGQAHPATDGGWSVRVRRLRDVFFPGRFRIGGVLLLVAVGFVLLIVCANLAGLLVARAMGRQQEIATRVAIGAGRRHVSLQLLTESLMLAVLALPVALLTTRGTLVLMLGQIPDVVAGAARYLRFDETVLVFVIALGLGTVLVFGLIPALQATRLSLTEALKAGGRGGSAVRQRIRTALAVAQIALAIALLTTSALLVQSFANLYARDAGYDPQGLLTAQVQLPPERYASASDWLRYQRQILRRARALPGAEGAATLSGAAFFEGSRAEFEITGRPRTSRSEAPSAVRSSVSTDFFAVLGLRELAGRVFGEGDREGRGHAVVVNQTLARRYFGSASDALGERLVFASGGEPREIVGVVSDQRNTDMREPPVPHVYEAFEQVPSSEMHLLLRAGGAPPQVLRAALQRELRQVDALVPASALLSVEERIEENIWTAGFLQNVMVSLSLFALSLAAIGVYGVVSYATSQRTHEFGIRMALGAEPVQIFRLVLRQGVAIAVAGIAVGLALTFVLLPSLRSVLYDMEGWSPGTFLAIALLLGTVVLLASAVPALRATRSDPVDALRVE